MLVIRLIVTFYQFVLPFLCLEIGDLKGPALYLFSTLYISLLFLVFCVDELSPPKLSLTIQLITLATFIKYNGEVMLVIFIHAHRDIKWHLPIFLQILYIVLFIRTFCRLSSPRKWLITPENTERGCVFLACVKKLFPWQLLMIQHAIRAY